MIEATADRMNDATADLNADRPRLISSAAKATSEYFAAMTEGDVRGLEAILHPVWTAKRAAPGGKAEVEERTSLLRRADAGGALQGAPEVTSVQIAHPDFAIVRADDWKAPSGTIFLLLTSHRGWRIVGEATAGAAGGFREERFSARSEESAVFAVLEEYYRAVTVGDPDALRRIFAPFWQMKNRDGDAIVAEGVDAFVARVAPGPLPGYWDDRQIADVQLIAGRLAYVRVDKPSVRSTTVFMFMKIAGRWLVIDKAWSAGRA